MFHDETQHCRSLIRWSIQLELFQVLQNRKFYSSNLGESVSDRCQMNDTSKGMFQRSFPKYLNILRFRLFFKIFITKITSIDISKRYTSSKFVAKSNKVVCCNTLYRVRVFSCWCNEASLTLELMSKHSQRIRNDHLRHPWIIAKCSNDGGSVYTLTCGVSNRTLLRFGAWYLKESLNPHSPISSTSRLGNATLFPDASNIAWK